MTLKKDFNDKELKLALAKDLEDLASYLSLHKLDSYLLVVNSDNSNYFYSWNFRESPNLLVAHSELSLHELKQKIVEALGKLSISEENETVTRRSRLN